MSISLIDFAENPRWQRVPGPPGARLRLELYSESRLGLGDYALRYEAELTAPSGGGADFALPLDALTSADLPDADQASFVSLTRSLVRYYVRYARMDVAVPLYTVGQTRYAWEGGTPEGTNPLALMQAEQFLTFQPDTYTIRPGQVQYLTRFIDPTPQAPALRAQYIAYRAGELEPFWLGEVGATLPASAHPRAIRHIVRPELVPITADRFVVELFLGDSRVATSQTYYLDRDDLRTDTQLLIRAGCGAYETIPAYEVMQRTPAAQFQVGTTRPTPTARAERTVWGRQATHTVRLALDHLPPGWVAYLHEIATSPYHAVRDGGPWRRHLLEGNMSYPGQPTEPHAQTLNLRAAADASHYGRPMAVTPGAGGGATEGAGGGSAQN